jgi:ferritin-like metal-binding protein YciE
MKMKSLNDLLVDQLKDLYSAESQLIKALPRMAKAASSEDLRAGFEKHLEETEGQLERLDQCFELLEARAKGKKCKAMEGLIEEGKELLQGNVDPDVLDAGLIAAAQKVEHYEIASYGCTVTWAERLGLTQVAKLLQETLDEEKATDVKLTELAESMVNADAVDGSEADEEEMATAGPKNRNGRGKR